MSSHDAIWQRVVEGKTKWSPEDTSGSLKRFEAEIVDALLRFEREGRLRVHISHYSSRRGRKWPDIVEVELVNAGNE